MDRGCSGLAGAQTLHTDQAIWGTLWSPAGSRGASRCGSTRHTRRLSLRQVAGNPGQAELRCGRIHEATAIPVGAAGSGSIPVPAQRGHGRSVIQSNRSPTHATQIGSCAGLAAWSVIVLVMSCPLCAGDGIQGRRCVASACGGPPGNGREPNLGANRPGWAWRIADCRGRVLLLRT